MELELLLNQIKSVNSYRVLVLPFSLMVIDFLTGVFNAWATGHLKSYRMREDLIKNLQRLVLLWFHLYLHGFL